MSGRGQNVLLMTLSVRTSAKGNQYLAGWLGKASVVGFAGEPDKRGNPTWDIYVAEPMPRDDTAVTTHTRQHGGEPPAH